MFNFKNKKAITLISLVITIVIMLILVGVTVNIVIGDGLIGQAEKAAKAQAIAQETEKIEMAGISAKLNSPNFELTTEKLEESLRHDFGEEYGELTENENGWNYVGKSETYNISKEGQVMVKKQILNYKIYGNYVSLLPDEYQQVEYIESTGRQYIDTEVATTSGYRVKTCINISNWYWYGADASSYFAGFLSRGIYRDYTVFYQSKPMVGMNTDVQSTVTCSLNTWYDVDASTISGNGYFILNNDLIVTSTNTVKHEKFNIWLLGVNYYNTGKFWNCLAKIKITEIYNSDNILERYFIPCYRKSDNMIGMYDTVTQKFFTNQGEGDFLKGKIVGVGEIGDDDKYTIPLKLTTTSGEQTTTTVTLDSPLRKVGDVADYLDLKNKKVVRYIGEDGKILENDKGEVTPIEEIVEIENLPEIKDIISIEVNTTIQPSKIVE